MPTIRCLRPCGLCPLDRPGSYTCFNIAGFSESTKHSMSSPKGHDVLVLFTDSISQSLAIPSWSSLLPLLLYTTVLHSPWLLLFLCVLSEPAVYWRFSKVNTSKRIPRLFLSNKSVSWQYSWLKVEEWQNQKWQIFKTRSSLGETVSCNMWFLLRRNRCQIRVGEGPEPGCWRCTPTPSPFSN